MTNRWRRIEVLYHEVLAHPVHERAAALEAGCHDDAALRGEVQSLLDQPDSGAGYFVSGPHIPRHHVSPARSSFIGRRIGAFEIEGLLGLGGMGEVYRARDTRLGRAVAIKVLPCTSRDDPGRLARFAREGRLLAAVNHPHIGAVYGL